MTERTTLPGLWRWRQRRAARLQIERDQNERAAIAKAFNDRYCFLIEYAKGLPRLPGTAYGTGIAPHGGFAWMCPECNQVHHPHRCSVFSGLQYPACCSTPEGHRLNEGIRTRPTHV